MKRDEFNSLFNKQWTFSPTQDQQVAMQALTDFMFSRSEHPLFLLKGYAGTGKTTLISNFVQLMNTLSIKTVLMAPTGRAAKVMGLYSGQAAGTIHRRIYFRGPDNFGNLRFTLQQNLHTHTIFIADEASMIGDQSDDGSNLHLLQNLLDYVYSGNNCRLILVGDAAQLPPVGLTESPALNVEYLKSLLNLHIWEVELKEVLRQAGDSGILYNATKLRVQLLSEEKSYPRFEIKDYPDFYRLEGSMLQDELEIAFRNFGVDDTIVLCRSNKRAVLFNMQIRSQLLWYEEELSVSDLLMVVRNNYFWLPEGSKAGFIANGDTLRVLRVGPIRELYGFRFSESTVQMIDYPEQEPVKLMLLLDALQSDSPSVAYSDLQRLYQAIAADYPEIKDKKKLAKVIMSNPYYNALQVKYAYAVTGHKSQGGQWSAVFIDQGYFTDEQLGEEWLRWLYTAITRAKEKVYLINFKEEFFADEHY